MPAKVSILIVHKSSFYAWLVSLTTLCWWNHVAIRIGDYVYEINRDGISKWDYFQYVSRFQCLEYEVSLDPSKAENFIFSNWNIKYDYIHTIGWLFRGKFDLNDTDKWNCCEMIYSICTNQDPEMFPEGNHDPKSINKHLIKRLI